ncbi:unnamed protein product [Cylicocyclus nassatus]|uniref:Uncharacterized protein n=1 Tax=Cylicocyclus nassatus TaxID=53992 RepID=A0AA36GT26_CYLNA|nr:unnamed protein product [Cylicocyclus nassatus]
MSVEYFKKRSTILLVASFQYFHEISMQVEAISTEKSVNHYTVRESSQHTRLDFHASGSCIDTGIRVTYPNCMYTSPIGKLLSHKTLINKRTTILLVESSQHTRLDFHASGSCINKGIRGICMTWSKFLSEAV